MTKKRYLRQFTQAEKVLVALYRAANGTTAQVPYEEIVIQAWRDFPQTFSLRNHPEHPDSSDIHKRIYQTLKPKGLVIALGIEEMLGGVQDLVAPHVRFFDDSSHSKSTDRLTVGR